MPLFSLYQITSVNEFSEFPRETVADEQGGRMNGVETEKDTKAFMFGYGREQQKNKKKKIGQQ